jgi:hypothetical protein
MASTHFHLWHNNVLIIYTIWLLIARLVRWLNASTLFFTLAMVPQSQAITFHSPSLSPSKPFHYYLNPIEPSSSHITSWTNIKHSFEVSYQHYPHLSHIPNIVHHRCMTWLIFICLYGIPSMGGARGLAGAMAPLTSQQFFCVIYNLIIYIRKT